MSNVVQFRKPKAAKRAAAERHIVTEYRLTKNHLIRANRAVHPDSAILCALKHMQADHYAAKTCEVIDEKSGLVLCSMTWLARRELKITYTARSFTILRGK